MDNVNEWLKVSIGRTHTSGYLQAQPRNWARNYPEQHQAIVKTGRESATSEFQVRRPGHSVSSDLTTQSGVQRPHNINIHKHFLLLSTRNQDAFSSPESQTSRLAPNSHSFERSLEIRWMSLILSESYTQQKGMRGGVKFCARLFNYASIFTKSTCN